MQPDKGKVAICIDCSPTAEPTFEVVYFGSSSFQVYYFADSGPLHGCGFLLILRIYGIKRVEQVIAQDGKSYCSFRFSAYLCVHMVIRVFLINHFLFVDFLMKLWTCSLMYLGIAQ